MRPFTPALVLGLAVALLAASPLAACTSFCLDTRDGPFFATNLDLKLDEGLIFVNRRGLAKEGYQRGTTGEVARWVSRYGSVTFNLAGRELAWCGMNEAGLVVSQMALDVSVLPAPDERPPFDNSSWVQYVLDTCGSVEDLVRMEPPLRLNDRTPCHFLVADADGRCAAVEYLNGRMVCYTGERVPVKVMTNVPYAAGVAFLESGVVPDFNPGRSVQRVAAAAAEIDAFGAGPGDLAVDHALRVLTEVVVARRSFWSDLFHEPYTRWSIVFDIPRREVHFRTVDHPGVRRFALDRFDLSCEAPVRMLDVNADLEGAVETKFEPYDHDANLKLFRTFCDRWGVRLSREASASFVRLMEGFECAR